MAEHHPLPLAERRHGRARRAAHHQLDGGVELAHRAGGLRGEFAVVLRFAEVLSASLDDGAPVGQWADTNNATQVWTLDAVGSQFQLVNANSGKLLEIPGASAADGVDAVQWAPTGDASQRWLTQRSGAFWWLQNANSGKLLEVQGASAADGALLQQRTADGSQAQQWRLVREAIQ
ncbi:RICIN domain-containing protein [Arenivirga flava]|uniref:RICIN domain-containing protein n=1 Tax=Arenivirga flava TaxID=1930060 RepID=UPI0032AF5404